MVRAAQTSEERSLLWSAGDSRVLSSLLLTPPVSEGLQ